MNNDEQPDLLYHAHHRRASLPGCLPIALLLACMAIGGVLLVLNVAFPQRIVPRGEGQIYFNNQELIHFQIRHRTPLPLNIPAYADPARRESAAVVEKGGRILAEPLQAAAFDFKAIAPDSVVLGNVDLLALPPEDENDGEAENDGDAVDDAGSAPAGAGNDGAPEPRNEEVQP